MSHIMKTTLDLDTQLLSEAKAVAARRRITLKAMVEHALRREIQPASELENPNPDLYQEGPFGMLSLKKRSQPIPAGQVQELIDHQYDEEDTRVIDSTQRHS